jgi:hypothetical protein
MAKRGDSNTNRNHCSASVDGVKRKKKRAFWEGFPFAGARVEERDEKHLRNGQEMSKVKR